MYIHTNPRQVRVKREAGLRGHVRVCDTQHCPSTNKHRRTRVPLSLSLGVKSCWGTHGRSVGLPYLFHSVCVRSAFQLTFSVFLLSLCSFESMSAELKGCLGVVLQKQAMLVRQLEEELRMRLRSNPSIEIQSQMEAMFTENEHLTREITILRETIKVSSSNIFSTHRLNKISILI